MPAFGDERLEHFTLMVDRPPEIVELAVYLHENLIQMPGPVRVETIFDAALSDRLREQRSGPVPPETHCFMRDVDTAFVQEIFNVTQREREADIHHHRKADDLGRCFAILERVTHQTRL